MALPAMIGRLFAGEAAAGEAAATTRVAGRAAVGSRGADKLNRLWSAQATWDLADKVLGSVSGNLPQFQQAITVTCVGGPQADLRRVWYLALAAAFGRYRNRVRTVGATKALQAEWDITGKGVTVELVNQTNALVAGLTGVATKDGILERLVVITAVPLQPFVAGIGRRIIAAETPGRDSTGDACSFIQKGPDQITIGGPWPSFLRAGGQVFLAGPAAPIPTSSFKPTCGSLEAARAVDTATLSLYGASILREWPQGTAGKAQFFPYRLVQASGLSGAPVGSSAGAGSAVSRTVLPFLPDAGRVITTGEKTDPRVQPPRPALDGRTRSSLLSLVAQTLQNPCFLPEAPPCTETPVVSTGVFIHGPGANIEDYDKIDTLVNAARTIRPVPVGGSLVDGYTLPPGKVPNLIEK